MCLDKGYDFGDLQGLLGSVRRTLDEFGCWLHGAHPQPGRRGPGHQEGSWLQSPALGGGTDWQEMIGRAVAAGVPFAWVTGDTVYGNDRRLRRWLEEQGRCYVLAVKNNEPLWADTERGSAQVAARRLAEEIPDDEWQRLSAGDGSKGPRLYDWGWLPIRPWSEPGRGHWLLVRRTDPEDLACFGEPLPADIGPLGQVSRQLHLAAFLHFACALIALRAAVGY